MKNSVTLLSLSLVLLAAASTYPKIPKETENGMTLPNQCLIAYNVLVPDSSTESNYEVFIMHPDGSHKTNITNNPDVAWTYLAVKDKILFISDRDTCHRCYFLHEMDPTGRNIRQITDFPLRDSWMDSRDDGKELIVTPHRQVDSAFYIINRQGEIVRRINTGLASASDPAFSPDGERIAFRGANRKSKREEGYKEEIYLINVDGTGLRQLTTYPSSDTTAPWFAYKAGPPRWHPTENFISYQSMQHGKYSLYGVTPDGTRHWKLTSNNQEEGYHAWSPDGKWLAVELFDADQSQFHIGLMDWGTKQMKILTDTTFRFQQAPVFVGRRTRGEE